MGLAVFNLTPLFKAHPWSVRPARWMNRNHSTHPTSKDSQNNYILKTITKEESWSTS